MVQCANRNFCVTWRIPLIVLDLLIFLLFRILRAALSLTRSSRVSLLFRCSDFSDDKVLLKLRQSCCSRVERGEEGGGRKRNFGLPYLVVDWLIACAASSRTRLLHLRGPNSHTLPITKGKKKGEKRTSAIPCTHTHSPIFKSYHSACLTRP